MCSPLLSQLVDLTRTKNCQSVKELLESPPTGKDKLLEDFIAELYRGNGWIAIVKGGRSDQAGDVLLSHPRSPNIVSWVVQCKNWIRPLTWADTRIELVKFEEKGAAR